MNNHMSITIKICIIRSDLFSVCMVTKKQYGENSQSRIVTHNVEKCPNMKSFRINFKDTSSRISRNCLEFYRFTEYLMFRKIFQVYDVHVTGKCIWKTKKRLNLDILKIFFSPRQNSPTRSLSLMLAIRYLIGEFISDMKYFEIFFFLLRVWFYRVTTDNWQLFFIYCRIFVLIGWRFRQFSE